MRLASGKLLLASFGLALAAMIVIHAVDFPGSVPHFKTLSGGLDLLDTKPTFDASAAHARIEAYGEAAREAYKTRLFTVDLLLPLCVFPFLFLFMFGATDKLRLAPSLRVALLILPSLYLAFDLIENAVLLDMLSAHPARHAASEAALPWLTSIKRAGILSGLFGPPLLYGLAFLRKR